MGHNSPCLRTILTIHRQRWWCDLNRQNRCWVKLPLFKKNIYKKNSVWVVFACLLYFLFLDWGGTYVSVWLLSLGCTVWQRLPLLLLVLSTNSKRTMLEIKALIHGVFVAPCLPWTLCVLHLSEYVIEAVVFWCVFKKKIKIGKMLTFKHFS